MEIQTRCRAFALASHAEFFRQIAIILRRVLPPFTVLLVVFLPVAVFARGAQPHPLVCFTGVFWPLEEKGRSGAPTLTVRVTDVVWIFRIAKIENLRGTDLSELGLFRALFPPRVHFVGSEDLLRPLRDPAIVGRRLSIQGYLYTADRVLWVTAIEEIAPE